MTRRTCDELGVCQGRAECHGCSNEISHLLPNNAFVFAPGVIEKTSRRRWLTPRRVDSLARAVLVLAVVAAAVGAVALLSGYVSVHFGGLL